MRSPAQSGMTAPNPNATKGKLTLPLRPIYIYVRRPEASGFRTHASQLVAVAYTCLLVNNHHLAGFAGLHNRIDDLQTAKALLTSAARHRFLAQAKIDEVVSL